MELGCVGNISQEKQAAFANLSRSLDLISDIPMEWSASRCVVDCIAAFVLLCREITVKESGRSGQATLDAARKKLAVEKDPGDLFAVAVADSSKKAPKRSGHAPSKLRCWNCGEDGHTRDSCTEKKDFRSRGSGSQQGKKV